MDAIDSSNILRLRGLIFSATEEDVRTFFMPLEIVDVHIISRNGKPTGEAYVSFDSKSTAAAALDEKQHQNLGHRYVEIFDALEAELVTKNMSDPDIQRQPSLRGHVLRLRGLPFTATAEDVIGFLAPVRPIGGPAGVAFMCTTDCRFTGEAYVELACEDDQATVLGKHKELLGSRYIEVFESCKGAFLYCVHQHGYISAVGGRRQHHMPASPSQYQHMVGAGGQADGRRRQQQQQPFRDVATEFSSLSLGRQDGSQLLGGYYTDPAVLQAAVGGVGGGAMFNAGGGPARGGGGAGSTGASRYDYGATGSAPVMMSPINPYVLAQQGYLNVPQMQGPPPPRQQQQHRRGNWAGSGTAPPPQTGASMMTPAWFGSHLAGAGGMGMQLPGTYQVPPPVPPYGPQGYGGGYVGGGSGIGVSQGSTGMGGVSQGGSRVQGSQGNAGQQYGSGGGGSGVNGHQQQQQQLGRRAGSSQQP